MLLRVVLLGVVVGWLVLLYRNNHDRSGHLLAAAVAAGLLLLAMLRPLGQLVVLLGAPLVQGAQALGWLLGPLWLLAVVCWVAWRLLRGLWWRWPQRSTSARCGVLAGSLALGVMVAAIAHAIPLLGRLGGLARHAATVGLRSARSLALEGLTAVFTAGPLDLPVVP